MFFSDSSSTFDESDFENDVSCLKFDDYFDPD